jgi:hypothetical protein
MSFDSAYDSRFKSVIAPAVRSIRVGEVNLEPKRVDLSKSGDCIITEIMDGIAHSQMVLADISTVGTDKRTGKDFRNSNVMLELGFALACRQPTEVLIVKDDKEPTVFDLSTIPYQEVDFVDEKKAIELLSQHMTARLSERNRLLDLRVQAAVSTLSSDELCFLMQFKDWGPGTKFGYRQTGSVNFREMAAVPRLLDNGVIRLVGQFEGEGSGYMWTDLGSFVVNTALNLPRFKVDQAAQGPSLAPSG